MSKTIEVVGVGAFTSAAGAMTAVPVPANLKINDLLMIVIMSANETISLVSTGWTQIGNQTVQATGTAGAQNAVRLGVYYKFAGATEAAVSVADSGNINAAQTIAFRYVNKNNPFIATSGGAQASAAAAPTLPGITTTVPGALIFFAMAVGLDATGTNNFSALTNANLNTITERMDATTNTQTGGGVAAWTAYAALTGAIGNSTTTKAAAWTDATAYLTIGLRPKARRFSVS